VTTPVDPMAIAVSVSRVLEALGIVHTIGGSIASSFAGEPRSTADIDFVVALEESDVASLVSRLSTEFYVVDLFVAGGTPLDWQQLQRRQKVTLGPGQTLHVHPPEDILLQKLRWYREGGGVSDRQWRDILGIVRVQGPRLDRAYLTLNAPVLRVDDLLARALSEA
jgi:hypothetical protein